MNFSQFVYNFLASGLSLLLLPAVWCHEKRNPERRAALAQRMGHCPPILKTHRRSRPTIWIHAVSVGEVKAAEAIVQALDAASANVSLLLTTTTMTGQHYARSQFKGLARVQYAPVDLWWTIGRFLSAHRPDLLVCMETEIWPNWITRAHSAGVKIIFLNGRISHRTIRSYKKLRALIKPVLEKVDAFSMISEPDARRIISLGAPADRVQINGNVKTDARDSSASSEVLEDWKRIYSVDDHTPVFIAGSIREAEADILFDVYVRLAATIPDLVFIVAPRHIEKSQRVAECAHARGVEWQYRTDLVSEKAGRHAPVVILNTIGELRYVYSLASVVFCGASLVPLGGQNVLEPAMWAKPVLFGPSMEDFEEARMLLEASGGGMCVQDGQALAERAGYLLAHPEEARRLGRLAKRAVLSNQGAARRHARVIATMLALPWR